MNLRYVTYYVLEKTTLMLDYARVCSNPQTPEVLHAHLINRPDMKEPSTDPSPWTGIMFLLSPSSTYWYLSLELIPTLLTTTNLCQSAKYAKLPTRRKRVVAVMLMFKQCPKERIMVYFPWYVSCSSELSELSTKAPVCWQNIVLWLAILD